MCALKYINKDQPTEMVGRLLSSTEKLQILLTKMATMLHKEQKSLPMKYAEELEANNEWADYKDAQRATAKMLKLWRDMPKNDAAEKLKKAKAGKLALAALAFTGMNPIRPASWRQLKIVKTAANEQRCVVTKKAGAVLHFKGPGSFKNHKYIGDLQLPCGKVLSDAIYEYSRGDRKVQGHAWCCTQPLFHCTWPGTPQC